LRTINGKEDPFYAWGMGNNVKDRFYAWGMGNNVILLCCVVCVLSLKKKTLKQLLTMDTSVPKSIKTAAKCDISCELQNSVNH